MAPTENSGTELRGQVRAAWVITKKNARVYYLKPPVIIFGTIFPAFFFLAFATGHDAPVERLVPGVVVMALFFTASAVGPLVTPWERQARTYERLVTSPAALPAILAGDVLSGLLFGAVLTLVALVGALALTPARIVAPLELAAGWVLGAAAFSALGVMLSAPATEGPSQANLLSNLVRLPLIFVSGVFMPHASMPAWAQALSPISPLSYCADLVRVAFGGESYFSPVTDVIALVGFTTAFLVVAWFFHDRARVRGL